MLDLLLECLSLILFVSIAVSLNLQFPWGEKKIIREKQEKEKKSHHHKRKYFHILPVDLVMPTDPLKLSVPAE